MGERVELLARDAVPQNNGAAETSACQHLPAVLRNCDLFHGAANATEGLQLFASGCIPQNRRVLASRYHLATVSTKRGGINSANDAAEGSQRGCWQCLWRGIRRWLSLFVRC